MVCRFGFIDEWKEQICWQSGMMEEKWNTNAEVDGKLEKCIKRPRVKLALRQRWCGDLDS